MGVHAPDQTVIERRRGPLAHRREGREPVGGIAAPASFDSQVNVLPNRPHAGLCEMPMHNVDQVRLLWAQGLTKRIGHVSPLSRPLPPSSLVAQRMCARGPTSPVPTRRRVAGRGYPAVERTLADRARVPWAPTTPTPRPPRPH